MEIVLKLLDWPVLLFVCVLWIVFRFEKEVRSAIDRGGVSISWRGSTLTIGELPDYLDRNFAPLDDEIQTLKERFTGLEEPCSRSLLSTVSLSPKLLGGKVMQRWDGSSGGGRSGLAATHGAGFADAGEGAGGADALRRSHDDLAVEDEFAVEDDLVAEDGLTAEDELAVEEALAAEEGPAAEEPDDAPPVDRDQEAIQKMLDELAKGKYGWRTLDRLALVAGVRLEKARELLDGTGKVEMEPGIKGQRLVRHISSRSG